LSGAATAMGGEQEVASCLLLPPLKQKCCSTATLETAPLSLRFSPTFPQELDKLQKANLFTIL
jgi:hypothetical protein